MHIRSLAVEAKICFDLEKIKNLFISVDENFCNVAPHVKNTFDVKRHDQVKYNYIRCTLVDLLYNWLSTCRTIVVDQLDPISTTTYHDRKLA